MATELPTTNGHGAQDGENNFAVKAGLARMLKGGVIMDVINAEQVSALNFELQLQLQLPMGNASHTHRTMSTDDNFSRPA